MSSDELLNILSISSVATAIYSGSNLNICFANDAMLNLWGKDKTVVGKNLNDAVPEIQGKPFISLLKEVWKTGQIYTANNTAAVLKVNDELQTCYFDFEYRPLINEHGETYSILHTATEVTGRVKAEEVIASRDHHAQELREELNASNEELTASNAELTSLNEEYLATNEELGAVNEEFAKEKLDKMTNQFKKMTTLINGFLNVSRLESGKIHLIKGNFELNALIREMVEETELYMTSHQISFSAGNDVQIIADRDKIGSVFSNLLGNAINTHRTVRRLKYQVRSMVPRY